MAQTGDRKRRGLLTQIVRRLVLPALASETDAIDRAVATARDLEVAVRAQLEETGRAIEELRTGIRTAEGEAGRRIDQAQLELGDVRSAFLTTRQEFEHVRDHAVPAIEKRLDVLSDENVATIQRELAVLRTERVAEVETALSAMSRAIEAVQNDLAGLRDDRISVVEGTAALQHEAINRVQADLAELRDGRTSRLEARVGELSTLLEAEASESLAGATIVDFGELRQDLAELQRNLMAVQSLAEEVRDRRLPALSGRVDALVEDLNERLVATSGLLDRVVRKEPIGIALGESVETEVPAAVLAASRQFMDRHRGAEEEILARVREYVPLLRPLAPVLDLGCGRGELLRALLEEGIEATGIDADPALVSSCREAGLDVREADLVAGLAQEAAGSRGAVVAVHVFEHLPTARWMQALSEAARVVRPGGAVVVECPNPGSIRVGASLFWTDPTHQRPVHPDAVEFVMRAVGLEVEEVRYMRPFPADQSLARDARDDATRNLAARLDEWLSGPRDFAVIGRKPSR